MAGLYDQDDDEDDDESTVVIRHPGPPTSMERMWYNLILYRRGFIDGARGVPLRKGGIDDYSRGWYEGMIRPWQR